jgi:hypothetical protein
VVEWWWWQRQWFRGTGGCAAVGNDGGDGEQVKQVMTRLVDMERLVVRMHGKHR